MQASHSHLILSAALSCVAAIPNHTIRYTALGLTAVCTLLYNIHIRSPLTSLHGLSQMIDQTTVRIRYATAHCPRYHFALTEQTLRLLQVDHNASRIYCHIRALEGFGWTKYRRGFKEINACIKRVQGIDNAVEHIIEAERQRQLSDDMNEVQTVLATAPPAAQIYPPTQYGTESV
ncbi:hypothetical protein C8F04DRAFT_1119418 [Mycena alexandri]|uniref:Uncharacterized protein n=1 Tax=Mycena alexandri TaxID=1745969 RepID=A0AAD6RX57_9AGAR|nr:hypothetical protein C8F04DRAFT_1159004 [Mycena alexandri]KAJ7028453.1 hypothetical protein C8F04DRAFT_1119418 [Mycena alexandri]